MSITLEQQVILLANRLNVLEVKYNELNERLAKMEADADVATAIDIMSSEVLEHLDIELSLELNDSAILYVEVVEIEGQRNMITTGRHTDDAGEVTWKPVSVPSDIVQAIDITRMLKGFTVEKTYVSISKKVKDE